MNFYSYTCDSYKKGLVKTLVDRVFRINNCWEQFHIDLSKLVNILQRNEYPRRLVDNCIYKYLDDKLSEKLHNTETDETSNKYYKLPFIGKYSKITQTKINNLVKRFCKPNIKVHLVFSSLKISSFFSTKDKIPFERQSFVVYKFICSGCEAAYVGETCRHLATRMHEHLVSDKKSHIFKHLNSSTTCKSKCDNNCFSILDKAHTKFGLKIKESINITQHKPTLNKQRESSTLYNNLVSMGVSFHHISPCFSFFTLAFFTFPHLILCCLLRNPF